VEGSIVFKHDDIALLKILLVAMKQSVFLLPRTYLQPILDLNRLYTVFCGEGWKWKKLSMQSLSLRPPDASENEFFVLRDFHVYDT